MTLILRGRKFGFLLEEVRQWLLIYDEDGTEAQVEAFLVMSETKLDELKEQREQLEATLKELQDMREKAITWLSQDAQLQNQKS